MKKISKPSIIISSLGRTGTTFIASFFQKYFKQISSYHEPGMITLKNKEKIVKFLLTYGFVNFGKYNIRTISNQRLFNKISPKIASKKILMARKKFIDKQKHSTYLESSYHFSSLLDIIPLIFQNYKIAYIIRDPRDWVQSCINYNILYGKKDLQNLLGNRPKPQKNSKYYVTWKTFSRFEKLCWLWNKSNSYTLSKKYDKNTQIFHFENLFQVKEKNQNFLNLINFLITVNKSKIEKPKNLQQIISNELTEKINKPENYNFPTWQSWNNNQAKTLNLICGNLMKKLEYGNEIEWKNKVNS